MIQMAVFNTIPCKELQFKELESFTYIEEKSFEDISFAPLSNPHIQSSRK